MTKFCSLFTKTPKSVVTAVCENMHPNMLTVIVTGNAERLCAAEVKYVLHHIKTISLKDTSEIEHTWAF